LEQKTINKELAEAETGYSQKAFMHLKKQNALFERVCIFQRYRLDVSATNAGSIKRLLLI